MPDTTDPRLYLAKNLLKSDGAIFISIDDHEVMNLRSVCDEIFGEENHIATISVLNNLKGRNDKKNVATCHEYIVAYGNENFESQGVPLTTEQLEQYKYKDQNGKSYALRDLRKRGGPDKRSDRPKMYFPIYFNERSGKCYLERNSAEDVKILPLLGGGRMVVGVGGWTKSLAAFRHCIPNTISQRIGGQLSIVSILPQI